MTGLDLIGIGNFLTYQEKHCRKSKPVHNTNPAIAASLTGPGVRYPAIKSGSEKRMSGNRSLE